MRIIAIFFVFTLTLTAFSLFAQPYSRGYWQRPIYPNYYYPNNFYDPLYTPYQPDNGPMRGPNSIEGHRHPAYK